MSDPYPEHTKLSKIQDKSQAIHEFLEWIENSKGAELCLTRFVSHHAPLQYSTTTLVAEFFGIDLQKVDQEKRKMIEVMRAENTSAQDGQEPS